MGTLIGAIALGWLLWELFSMAYDAQEETRAWHREDARKRRERRRKK